jgi:dATP pyrophosphohydrolase
LSEAYKQPESILLLIHTPALQILLIERALHPGYWQSVTGSREGTEALIDTARRELAEETGLIAAPGAIRDWCLANRFEILEQWRHRYAPGVSHNLEHVFSICVPEAIEVRLAPDEHRAQCWLPWQEAVEKCFSWTNQDAILMLPLRQKQGLTS